MDKALPSISQAVYGQLVKMLITLKPDGQCARASCPDLAKACRNPDDHVKH